jgi:ATP-dependent DNA helicase DinG
MSEIERIFSVTGALASAVPGYRPRAQQIAFAEAVATAIEQTEKLVAEAGTGTGKTFAYLVPALLKGGRVIVSTGTKNLQDQLFDRDLPALRDALRISCSVALLKGRANYVCHHHLERALADGRFTSRDDVRHLHTIARFAGATSTGDKADLSNVPETASVWSQVTSTRDNCLGQDCDHFKNCFVMAARREALAADLVVVNHHLFFADLVLRDEGLSELLPAANTVIFDEAHQLPEVGSLFFGESFSSGQILELARDTLNELLLAVPELPELRQFPTKLDSAARELRLAVPRESDRIAAADLVAAPAFCLALEQIAGRLHELDASLAPHVERSEGLGNCRRRAQELALRVDNWRQGKSTDTVRWARILGQSIQVHATPLSIAEPFSKHIDSVCRATVFVSATLAVNGDFTHYLNELGLSGARCVVWGSPFDFAQQALLYVPERLPLPNSSQHTEAVVEAALPLLRASGGRAFFLFTSLRAMRLAGEMLVPRLAQLGLNFPVLVQGEGSRSELLERFRRLGNAVLVASQSFWEGVDVRGEALSLVVIDKLPFQAPDDPVTAARIEAYRKAGRDAFVELQLPRAAINLKQGAGRLIRAETDRGVLMIGDVRLVERGYGRRIWRSLPPMRRSRSEADAVGFFAAAATELAAAPN